MSLLASLLIVLSLLPAVFSQTDELTVYTHYGTGSASTPFQTAICVSAGACDGNVLKVLDIPPAGEITKTATINLVTGNSIPGLGHKVKADFVGFSVELSVANQICRSFLFFPLLHLNQATPSGKRWQPCQPDLPQSHGHYRTARWKGPRKSRRQFSGNRNRRT